MKEIGNVSIFQTMEHPTPEPMEEVDDDMLSPGAREAREKRRGPKARDDSQDFPGPPEAQQGNLQQEGDLPAQGVTDGPNGDDATKANKVLRDNMSLRSTLENLLKINKIEMQPHFIQQLDEITKAGLPGKDLLLDMIQNASTGSDPAPEGDSNRPLTQADVKVLATRLAEAKKQRRMLKKT